MHKRHRLAPDVVGLKAYAIIESCRTIGQLQTTSKWLDLAARHLPSPLLTGLRLRTAQRAFRIVDENHPLNKNRSFNEQ